MARSLRDREWILNNQPSLPFARLQAGPRGERLECESRRDVAHVARSLRDREWILNNQPSLPFARLQTGPRGERLECESRRDIAHVARSLRDREWILNNQPPLSSARVQTGPRGERLECESRRDAATCGHWPASSQWHPIDATRSLVHPRSPGRCWCQFAWRQLRAWRGRR